MRLISIGSVAALGAALSACAMDDGAPLDDTFEGELKPAFCDRAPEPRADLSRDVWSTKLNVQLDAHTARAKIVFEPAIDRGLSFRVGDLQITGVRDICGPLNYRVTDGQLDIGTRPLLPSLAIDYTFSDHPGFDGWMPTGSTFTWPYFCENLFPCHPQLADGVHFQLDVTGAPEGQTLVYPDRIPGAAPVYMAAWAVGEYTEVPLGRTSRGTDVSVWYLPGQETDALAGTAHLKDAFDFFETAYGSYSFGDKVGSVAANWGPGAYGGMEHHPYWHVAGDAMGDKEVHHHEAAHGWFGNGIRPKCWEDFVLSEGTAEYLTTRSIRATEGVEAEAALWVDWRGRLERAISRGDTYALPDSTCNEIDIFNSPLWSYIPYIKGAFFYKALEKAIGTAAIDRALSTFYRRNVGHTARMQELLDLVKRQTGYDPTPLASVWLRGLGLPSDIP